MQFMLGTKESMTQLFTEKGAIPATAIQAGPVTVTAVRTQERDGYSAVQVGFLEQSEKHLSKSVIGHTKGKGNFRMLVEFRMPGDKAAEVSEGDVISLAEVFSVGDTVAVSGLSKGKGFQGVVKRHGFSGGPRTHGQKHNERSAGSIGAKGVARVLKGTKMPGRMGHDRVTVRNLTVLGVDAETNTLYLSGAVPGRRGTHLELRKR